MHALKLQGVKWKSLHLGEVVDANRMASTPYLLNFLTDRLETVCEKTLSDADLKSFRKVSTIGNSAQMNVNDDIIVPRAGRQGGLVLPNVL